MASKSKYYNTGGGELFFTPIVNGVKGVEVDFGQTENISFSTEIETLTHDNSESCVVYEDMNILKKVTGKLTIETLEISPEMLTRAFLGTNVTTPVAANAIATTASLGFVTVVATDVAYPIGVKFLTESSIVVKDDTGISTYVLGTDYTLSSNPKSGVTMVTALSSGAIAAGDVIHVTGDNVAYNDIRIEAFTQTKIEGVLRFVSCAANGVSYVYTYHRVSLLASGDFALKNTSEFSKLSFEGTMLADETITGVGESKLFKIEGSEAA